MVDKRAVIGSALAIGAVIYFVARAKGEEPPPNGGNGGSLPDILEPVYIENCEVNSFTVTISSGWWGTTYSYLVPIIITYTTQEQIPLEPSPAARIIVDMTLAEFTSQIISSPIDSAQDLHFPAGTTVIARNMGFGGWPEPKFSAGEMIPYEVTVEAQLGSDVLGRRTFTGEVQCLG